MIADSGCRKSDLGASSSNGSVRAEGLTSPDGRVSLRILDFDGLQRLIADKRGKVVVVDVWSTSCPPCVKSFPDLVALHRKFGPERLACVSVSLDYEGTDPPQRVAPAVLDFLTKQQATFDNVLASEEVFTMLKKLGVSAPPAVFVYNRDGKLREKFSEAGSKEKPIYERVGKLVEQLVQ
jgi:thiol-disulfide isomerase/thioredoxin